MQDLVDLKLAEENSLKASSKALKRTISLVNNKFLKAKVQSYISLNRDENEESTNSTISFSLSSLSEESLVNKSLSTFSNSNSSKNSSSINS